jgi:hypothetical protein
MNQSSVLTLAVATAVLPQLQAALEQSCCPCDCLRERVSALAARFLTAPITPASTLDFETSLQHLLTECGRQVVQAVFNQVEPEDPQHAPKHTQRDRQDYSRKNAKSKNRGGVATLFGKVELWRCLYEPLQEARDDRQPSFAPLELCLGIVAGNATPALAERVGRLSSQHTQQEMLDLLRRDHQVSWSVEVLRKVSAAVSAGIAPYLRAAQQQALLRWLAQARQSRGRYRPALAVGRDGIMVPIRGEETYKEAAVATLSVHDRRGRRLGTVYLGEMPQPLQVRLSEELTALLRGVLAGCVGPMPRLVYLTDAGHHQTEYFEGVLSRMEDPRRPGERLAWLWVVDYWHAAGYVSRLAAVLFSDGKARQAWSARMRQVLKEQDRGVIRVLASAAQYQGKKALSAGQEQEYWEAYNYLLRHSQEMRYSEYRRLRLPIGSGVTEAGCKVVFTQRFKESGMAWTREGGEVILRLRLAVLSGVWDQVYRDYLHHRPLVPLATPLSLSPRPDEQAA